ncbi:MAG TPA: SRPBCC domain-containing protein [Thermomicrobiales bacterium]|nr:SRPBCC domain-containing protein [Thermomicrobiales bacterium]
MKTLQYGISIDAPPQKVWDTMLAKETYVQWVSVSWPGSSYHGEWKQGSQIRFTGADGGGGTLAEITELEPYARVVAEHVAVLLEDGSEDRESDMAKGWIGTTEAYTFTGENGSTKLDVAITTAPEWASMFDEGWPKALEALKRLAEK